jgi:Trypsin-like peptidase domain
MKLSRLKQHYLFAGLLALSCFVPAIAQAQTAGYNPADYGKARLPTRQSTGDAATYIDANKGAFEPISELGKEDAIATLARPIGRIDVVLKNTSTGEEIGTSCTGSLLAGNRVLTNHHCLPVEGDLIPVKASILMNYLSLDGESSERFELDPKPLAANPKLDYAISQASGDPNARFGMVHFHVIGSQPGQSLMVIHHPLGRPKMMSRFRCLTTKEQPVETELRHRCDTLGGSSGSLMFDATGAVVALHREGGLDPKDETSFNVATPMLQIIADSAILKGLADADAGTAPDAQVAAPGKPDEKPTDAAAKTGGNLDIKSMNDILKGN